MPLKVDGLEFKVGYEFRGPCSECGRTMPLDKIWPGVCAECSAKKAAPAAEMENLKQSVLELAEHHQRMSEKYFWFTVSVLTFYSAGYAFILAGHSVKWMIAGGCFALGVGLLIIAAAMKADAPVWQILRETGENSPAEYRDEYGPSKAPKDLAEWRAADYMKQINELFVTNAALRGEMLRFVKTLDRDRQTFGKEIDRLKRENADLDTLNSQLTKERNALLSDVEFLRSVLGGSKP